MRPPEDFLASMPAAYARAFSASDIAEHARIVGRRGSLAAHAERCQTRAGWTICVVAGDRPGLLAMMTDALLVNGLSVLSAQAYCRQRPDGNTEAVAFFDLHLPGGTPSSRYGVIGDGLEPGVAELGAFLQTLTELVAEDTLLNARAGRARPVPVGGPPRVYFELEALRRDEYVLLVETADDEGVLYTISSVLHAQGVRIVACQIGTQGGIARNRFDIASAGGEPLSDVRLCDIQQAVFLALPQSPRR